MLPGVDTQFIDLIRDVTVTVIFAAIPPLLAQLFAWLSSRRQDERWRGGVERLKVIVEDAVDEVEQTYVRPMKLKSDGSLSSERQHEALRQAQAIVAQSLGQNGAKSVASRLGIKQDDLDRRIRSLIEAALARRQR